jgi:hypothetical protein
MTELQDIFAYALPATVFLIGSATGMLVCAAAALWPRSKPRSEWNRPAGHRAGLALGPTAPSIAHPPVHAAKTVIKATHQAGDRVRAGAYPSPAAVRVAEGHMAE